MTRAHSAGPGGLTETVGTDKTGYIGGQTVYMSARVLNNGQPVSGAAVKFTATKPNGIKIVMSATSGADGYARQSYVAGTKAQLERHLPARGRRHHGGKSVTANSTYNVSTGGSTTPPPAPAGLTETVGTDKTSYVGGQTVRMTARVLSNGQPVSGAPVTFIVDQAERHQDRVEGHQRRERLCVPGLRVVAPVPARPAATSWRPSPPATARA